MNQLQGDRKPYNRHTTHLDSGQRCSPQPPFPAPRSSSPPPPDWDCRTLASGIEPRHRTTWCTPSSCSTGSSHRCLERATVKLSTKVRIFPTNLGIYCFQKLNTFIYRHNVTLTVARSSDAHPVLSVRAQTGQAAAWRTGTEPVPRLETRSARR